MQNFDIVKKSSIDKTFRVAKIMADFDLKTEHSNEHFVGSIEMPENWQIGVIVGGSGTGKTTIAKELFQENIIQHFEYTHKSVIDDMPQNVDMETIEKMFYSVGFGSVPSWLKPYSVLSNGEKMRVDLARAMLEKEFIVHFVRHLSWQIKINVEPLQIKSRQLGCEQVHIPRAFVCFVINHPQGFNLLRR